MEIENTLPAEIKTASSTQHEKIASLDFIRVICTIGIVVFHVSNNLSEGVIRPLLVYASGSWGVALVTVFFMLSGAALFYTHDESVSLRTFYIKRWKRLMPAFFIAYIIVYLYGIYTTAEFFYRNASPWTLLLTLFGLDGYFLYLIPNCYILGEWFLGALILVYLLYPFLHKMANRHLLLSTLLLTALFIWQSYTSVFKINVSQNLISCVYSFFWGMIFMYLRRDWKNFEKWMPIIGGASLCLVCLIAAIPITNYVPLAPNIITHIFGFALFFALYWIGQLLMQIKSISNLFQAFSKITYPVFLTHHVVANYTVQLTAINNTADVLKTIAIVLLISIVLGYLLWKATYYIVKYKRIRMAAIVLTFFAAILAAAISPNATRQTESSSISEVVSGSLASITENKVQAVQDIQYCIDNVNDTRFSEIEDYVLYQGKTLSLSGWILDEKRQIDHADVYLILGDKCYSLSKEGRKDVSESFGLDDCVNCGWRVAIPYTDIVQGTYNIQLLIAYGTGEYSISVPTEETICIR